MEQTKKTAGWVFFAVNLAILLVSMVREFSSPMEVVFFLLGNAALWGILVKCSANCVCSADRIPVILFLDSMIFFMVKMNEWSAAFDPTSVRLRIMQGIGIKIGFIIIGLILMGMGKTFNNKILEAAAFEAWWFPLVTIFGYSVANWTENIYVRLLFFLYTLSNIAWWFLIRAISALNVKRRETTTVLGLGFLGKFVFIILFCSGYIGNICLSFSSLCMNYAGTILRTRNLILLMIVTAVCVVAFAQKGSIRGRFLKAPLLVAGTACVVKASMVYFVPGGFLAIFVYLGIMRANLSNTSGINYETDIKGGKLVQLFEPWVYSTGVIAALFLVSRSLWPVALLAVIFGIIVKNATVTSKKVGWPLLSIIFSAVTACVAVWFTKNQPGIYVVIAVICAALGILLYMSNQKHPSLTLRRTPRKAAIACAAVLFMALAVGGIGTKTDITIDYTTQTASVSLDANGKDAIIIHSKYKWSDSSVAANAFQDVTDNDDFYGLAIDMATQTQSSIPVSGKILTVVSLDSNGGFTTRKAFVQTFFGQFYQ